MYFVIFTVLNSSFDYVYVFLMELSVIFQLYHSGQWDIEVHRMTTGVYEKIKLTTLVGIECIDGYSSKLFHLYHGGGNRSTRKKSLTCRKSLTNFIK